MGIARDQFREPSGIPIRKTEISYKHDTQALKHAP